MCVCVCVCVCVLCSVQQPVSGGGVEGEGGGDVATRVGLFSPPYMGRRHSHYEERPSKSVRIAHSITLSSCRPDMFIH